MIKKFLERPPNFIFRIIIPLIFGIIGGFIFYNDTSLKSILGAGVTIPFTVSKGLLDGWAIEIANRKIRLKEKIVHCKYALSKISHVRNVLTSTNFPINSKALAIGDLESILTDIWKCCLDGEKPVLQQYKGIVGDYKTTLQKSVFDETIEPPIINFITDLQNIETYLKENS